MKDQREKNLNQAFFLLFFLFDFFLLSIQFFIIINLNYSKIISTQNVTQDRNLKKGCKVWKLRKTNINKRKQKKTKTKETHTKQSKNQKIKEREWEKKKKELPSQPASFFRMICSLLVCFVIKISWAQSIYVIEIMLSVRCHSKNNCFFWVI